MATLEILGKTLLLDKDGHLANPGDWSESVARVVAELAAQGAPVP